MSGPRHADAVLRAHRLGQVLADRPTTAAGPAPFVSTRKEKLMPSTPTPSQPPATSASPMVRRLAAEAGIDLHTVKGTGPGGRIRRQDLQAQTRNRVLAAVPSPVASLPVAASAPAPIGTNGRPVAQTWLVQENSGILPAHDPAARQLANELGVRLRTVHGTGDGGRITCADVRAAAPRPSATPSAATAFGADGRPTPPSAAVVMANRGRVPAHDPAARELADQLGVRLADVRGTGAAGRVTCSDVRQKVAVDAGEAFDIPPFTASGIPPQALLQVPVACRRAMAAATTHADAYRLVTEYGGLDNATAKARLAADRNVDHQHGGARARW